MRASSRLIESPGVSVIDCEFSNCGVGIYANGVKNLHLEGNNFEQCGVAVKAEEVDGLVARNNTNDSERSMSQSINKSSFVLDRSHSFRKFLTEEALSFCIYRLKNSQVKI
ncbi:hypothetical protein [Janthinobacterium lividum]|uniref:hypothetical protein n=1 Tax=Janthinobacterium lividum TaxID=29581 RepID=UPI001B82A050|nr:hypothetical protein [Janthinobacterium lividum]MBR7634858.1 hypothetical protein [Janthinobacterium lividum]